MHKEFLSILLEEYIRRRKETNHEEVYTEQGLKVGSELSNREPN